MTSTNGLSVCVLCGALPGDSPTYTDTGYELGRLLGERHHRLVFGGEADGVMGAVAQGANVGGASIIGLLPCFGRAVEPAPAQQAIVTKSPFDRWRTMFHLAEGFVALPGGYGTLEQLLAAMSMSAAGPGVDRPIALINVNGVWDPLVRLIDELADRRFLTGTDDFAIVDTPEAALDYVERGRRRVLAPDRRQPVGTASAVGATLGVPG